jgi:hypothetical protein
VLTRFDDDEVENVVRLIDSTDWVPWLEAKLLQATGRRRQLSLRAFAVGAVLTVLDRGLFSHRAISDTLHHRISPLWRQRLGVGELDVRTPGGRGAGEKRVARRFHAVRALVDPSGMPTGRVLTDEELSSCTVPLDPSDAQARRETLVWLTNQILRTSLTVMPEDLRGRIGDGLAVDGTLVESFAKGRENAGAWRSADPQAGWYVRTGNHDGGDGPKRGKRKRKEEHKWGYEATTVTSAQLPGAKRTPRLTLAFVLDKPGHSTGQNGTAALADWKSQNPGSFLLAGDMAYSHSRPEHFQLPARALGAKLVFDCRDDHLGVKASYAGALLVDGTWYCPAIPQNLITATEDFYAGTIDRNTWERRILAREPYALWAKDRGENRFMCPALAGKVACPRQLDTLNTVDARPKVRIPVDLAEDRICSNRQGVRIPVDVGAKYTQHFAHGSEIWRQHYNALRNGVEGGNSQMKDTNHEAVGTPGRRRLLGLAGTSIAVAFLLLATNIRMIRAALEPEVKRTRRNRRRRLEDYEPRRATEPAA